MLFISHTGESLDAPSNTLSAFQLSIERDADGFECDIHLSADNNLMISHDDSTLEKTGVELSIKESTVEKLKKLDFGSWFGPEFSEEKIPTLNEALAIIPKEKIIYIELKRKVHATKQLAQLISASSLSNSQIRIITFDEEVAREAKRDLPNIKVFWLTDYDRYLGSTCDWTSEQLIAKLDELGVDGVDSHFDTFIDRNFVQDVKNAGYEFHVWTIDDEDLAREYISFGVDSITSNKAAYLKNIIK